MIRSILFRVGAAVPVAATAFAVPAAAQVAAAPAPTLVYAFSARIELLPAVEQGNMDGARKRFIPIAGGKITGPDVTDKIARGIAVPPDSYYFRTSTTFDAPPGQYSWLRERVFVARGIRMPDHVVIDFYTVE